MIQKDIRRIKSRANIIHKIVGFIFFLGVMIVFAGVVASILFFFASPEKFNAVKGNLNWSINYTLDNGSDFFTVIPFKIIQPLNSSMFSAKYAIITYLLSSLFGLSLILYGIKQIVNILKSTARDITPFIADNAKSLKKLAYSIIIYSLVSDIVSNILCSVFVTKIFFVDLSNIHFIRALVGVLIFVIAEIFQYGVYLQNEYDTTL
ncbi:DUF2975 domain-containing protein [Desulfosporosinus shakirovi]|uniref:DUF2975 domain-containing protein n=1 Tax=Desulfosporosinus shakirovi TaxID=2885154 RepID=UPI001E488BF8|nr:DUF2975 domain-containing protein [Desulfosporosinus sp. SRJS8]MCB8818561.1 DUF2975 domain-containing protein [Desulfosporosinus sp. SRJS8]